MYPLHFHFHIPTRIIFGPQTPVSLVSETMDAPFDVAPVPQDRLDNKAFEADGLRGSRMRTNTRQVSGPTAKPDLQGRFPHGA